MATNVPEPESPEGKPIGKQFVCGKYLTGGSFGRIHLGKNTKTGEVVAVKLEAKASDKPQLPLEYGFYHMLGNGGAGIPKVYYFGPCGGWHALVMELMGADLATLHKRCDHRFSLRTTTQLAIQLIGIMDVFHGHRLVYRDTKPDNFMCGPPGSDKYNVVHIIDMGMCKEWKDESTGKHIPPATGKPWTGTVRYMSINNHKNMEQSRRDDMEALSYMLVFLHKGELPWQGVNSDNVPDKYRQIGDIKKRTKAADLCVDMPDEYKKFCQSVRDLEFEEEPKYKVYINMFTKLLTKLGHDAKEGVYDWDRQQKPRPAAQRK